MRVLITFILIISLFITDPVKSETIIKQIHKNPASKFNKIRDTLYTYANHIIEVYLPEQKIYLHHRDGTTEEFLCSTGNPRLDKGVDTPEGIFLIQNKARKVYSTQFDSTLMLNWLGFNFNIGFHALEGKSYYKYLGRRISSHGCIRISRETSEYFYKIILIGTPVIIHSGKSARVIAFANRSMEFEEVDKKSFRKLSKENLLHLYAGLYLNKRHKLIISAKSLGHSGIELGNEDMIINQLPAEIEPKLINLDRKLFYIETK